MKEAEPLRNGFRLYAPFTITTSAGGKTVAPKYRSLTIQAELTDGTSLSLSIPVISDTDFDNPIQLDFDTPK